ncbi:helix-turn-helix domain-containing protein [Corynebacterium sp. KPL2838]|uniref:helix-turn-helix transcriptional regulator n=1 Tax=Corynebacterium sp. KPL2838 TaxID=3158316 RepID=UPI0032EEF3F3
MTTKHLLGTAGAAETLGLSRQGVLKRVKDGRLAPIGALGKRGIYVFDRAEIEALASKEAAAK